MIVAIMVQLLFEHDLFRPAFARRSIKPFGLTVPGLRAGGKPASTRIKSWAGFFGIMLWGRKKLNKQPSTAPSLKTTLTVVRAHCPELVVAFG
jgi:hypothetical protein